MLTDGMMRVEVTEDMIKVNPYRPGAGLMPTYLAGREEDVVNIEKMFEALTLNIPTQSVIFIGLHGVGKTVLLNQLEKIAKGIIYSVKYKELDFTVPEFSGFIKRLEEYREWCRGDE